MLLPVNGDISPVHFNLIGLGEGMEKMVHSFLVRPHHCEIVNDKRKANRSIAVAKDIGGAR